MTSPAQHRAPAGYATSLGERIPNVDHCVSAPNVSGLFPSRTSHANTIRPGIRSHCEVRRSPTSLYTAPKPIGQLIEDDPIPRPLHCNARRDRLAAEVTSAMAEKRLGRNAPCWCGSGKKYKKCHLVTEEQAEAEGRTPLLPRAREYYEYFSSITSPPQIRSQDVGRYRG